MAKGFDDLIEFLLREVALCGDQGASTNGFQRFVRNFYAQPELGGDELSIGEQHNDQAPPAVDRPLLERSWEWLTAHPEIRIGDANQWSRLTLPEAESLTASSASQAHNDRTQQDVVSEPSVPPLDVSAVEQPTPDPTDSPVRIYTTEDRVWQAVAGHGVDWRRVPGSEFQLLSLISAQGERGIIQPELTRLSGQDKRSLPKRTDKLCEKGYIEKRAVFVKGCRTSLCVHKRYSKRLDGDQGRSSTSVDARDAFKNGRLDFDVVLDSVCEMLKDVKILAIDDLRQNFGTQGKRWETKTLWRALERLDMIGVVKRVKAKVQIGLQASRYLRCVKLVRTPTETDRKTFKHLASKDVVAWRHGKTAGDDVDGIGGDPDQDEDGVDIAEDTGNAGGQADSVPTFSPRWTSDQLANNLIFNLADDAGPSGISSMDLCDRSFGPFFRRPFEQTVSRLTDAWETSQPQHLQHLALIRDTTLKQRITHYTYRTYENFTKAAERGEAAWEAVRNTSKNSSKKTQKGRNTTNQADDCDEWGFPRIQSTRFVGQDGSATLLECNMAARIPPSRQTTFDPIIQATTNDETTIVWPVRDHDIFMSAELDTPRKSNGSEEQHPKHPYQSRTGKPLGRPRKHPKPEGLPLDLSHNRRWYEAEVRRRSEQVRRQAERLAYEEALAQHKRSAEEAHNGQATCIDSSGNAHTPNWPSLDIATLALHGAQAAAENITRQTPAPSEKTQIEHQEPEEHRPAKRRKVTQIGDTANVGGSRSEAAAAHPKDIMPGDVVSMNSTLSHDPAVATSEPPVARSSKEVAAEKGITISEHRINELVAQLRDISRPGLHVNPPGSRKPPPARGRPRLCLMVMIRSERLKELESFRASSPLTGHAEAEILPPIEPVSIEGTAATGRFAEDLDPGVSATREELCLLPFEESVENGKTTAVPSVKTSSTAPETASIAMHTELIAPTVECAASSPWRPNVADDVPLMPTVMPGSTAPGHERPKPGLYINPSGSKRRGRPRKGIPRPLIAVIRSDRLKELDLSSATPVPQAVSEVSSTPHAVMEFPATDAEPSGEQSDPTGASTIDAAADFLLAAASSGYARRANPEPHVTDTSLESQIPAFGSTEEAPPGTPGRNTTYVSPYARPSPASVTMYHSPYGSAPDACGSSELNGSLPRKSPNVSVLVQASPSTNNKSQTALSSGSRAVAAAHDTPVTTCEAAEESMEVDETPAQQPIMLADQSTRRETTEQVPLDVLEPTSAVTESTSAEPEITQLAHSYIGKLQVESHNAVSDAVSSPPAEAGNAPAESNQSTPKGKRPTARKQGVLLGGGIVGHLRTKVIMEIVMRCGGVFPGNYEIIPPFQAMWSKNHDGHVPDRDTVKKAVKNAIDSGKLRRIMFVVEGKNGVAVTKQLLLAPNVVPTAQKVKDMQERMKEIHPEPYYPPKAWEGVEDKAPKPRSDGFQVDDSLMVERQHKPAYMVDLDKKMEAASRNVEARRQKRLEREAAREPRTPRGGRQGRGRLQGLSRPRQQRQQSVLVDVVPDVLHPPPLPRLLPKESGTPADGSVHSRSTAPFDQAQVGEEFRTSWSEEQFHPTPSSPPLQLSQEFQPFFPPPALPEPELQHTPVVRTSVGLTLMSGLQALSDPGSSIAATPNATNDVLSDFRCTEDAYPEAGGSMPIDPRLINSEAESSGEASPGPDIGSTQLRLGKPSRSALGHTAACSRAWRSVNTDLATHDPLYEVQDPASLTSPDQTFYVPTGTFSTGYCTTKNARLSLWIAGNGRKTFAEMMPNSLTDIISISRKQGHERDHSRWADPAYSRYLYDLGQTQKWELESEIMQRYIEMDGLHLEQPRFINHTIGTFHTGAAHNVGVRIFWKHGGSQAFTLSRPPPLDVDSDDDVGLEQPRKRQRHGSLGFQQIGASPDPRRVSWAIETRFESATPRMPSPLPVLAGSPAPALAATAGISSCKRIQTSTRKQQGQYGEVSTPLMRKLLMAIIVIRTLSGGLDQSVDWRIVRTVFRSHATYDQYTFKQLWISMQKNHAELIRTLEEAFQDSFVAAYEHGDVPSIDYDNVDNYDWNKVVDWAQENIEWPSSGLSELPANREILDQRYMIKRLPGRSGPSTEELYKENTFTARRFELMHQYDYSSPVESASARTPERPIKENGFALLRAKSYLRANFATPAAQYDANLANNKLATVDYALREQAVSEMLESNMLSNVAKGRQVPGRNFHLTEKYHGTFKRPIEPSQLKNAAAYKQYLDAVFNSTTDTAARRVGIAYDAADSMVLAVTNLVAHRRVRLVPRLPEVDNDVSKRGPKLSKWGFTSGNYKTTKMDRENLHFGIDIVPTDTYIFGYPLAPLWERLAPPAPHLTDPTLEIPLWYDIHGRFMGDWWEKLLAAVLCILATRPGTNISTLVESFKGFVARWDLELVVDWLVKAEAVRRLADGGHEGLTTREWWWVVLARYQEGSHSR